MRWIPLLALPFVIANVIYWSEWTAVTAACTALATGSYQLYVRPKY